MEGRARRTPCTERGAPPEKSLYLSGVGQLAVFKEFGIGSTATSGPVPMDMEVKKRKEKTLLVKRVKAKMELKSNNHSGGDKSSKACLYCGKLGHFKRDSRKFLYDQKNGNVRQVEKQNQNPVPPAATDNASQSSTYFRTSQPGSSSSLSSHVRRVELAPLWNENDSVDDLDINFIQHNVDGCIRAVSFGVSHDCSCMISHDFDDTADSAAYMGAS